MNPKIGCGSICKLRGLVSQPHLNDVVVVQVKEMPSPSTNGRVAVARLDSEDNVLMHLKPECVVPCCAQCHTTGVKLKNCSACVVTFYCSSTCSTTAWKQGHRFLCAAIKSSSQEPPDAPPDASSYRLIDLGISVEEELLLLRLREQLDVEYQMTCLKDLHRDDLIALQIPGKKAHMEGRDADFLAHNERCTREVERQVTWSTRVDATDSIPLLAFKGLMLTILREMSHASGCRCRVTPEVERAFAAKSRQAIKEMKLHAQALEAAVRAKHPEEGDRCCEISWLERLCPLVKTPAPAVPGSAAGPCANPQVNRPPWFRGPSPLVWDHEWEILKFKMNHGPGGGHMFNMLENYNMVPTRKHGQKKMDFHSRFYKINYPKDAWDHFGCDEPHYTGPTGIPPRRPLPYWQHLQLHRQGNAKATLKAGAKAFLDSELLLLGPFLRTHDVAYPNTCVGRCDTCGVPTLGECLCGESYCSEACARKDWDLHESMCTQVLDNCEQYCLMVPLAWGQKAHNVFKDA